MTKKHQKVKSKTKFPKALHRGPLAIGETIVDAYVLDNGQRVVGGKALAKALGMGEKSDSAVIARLASSDGVSVHWDKAEIQTAVVEFRVPHLASPKQGSSKAHGFESDWIMDLCDAILESRDQGALHPNQGHIARAAERLIRGCARIGLTALIDEATGYRDALEKDEYQRTLALYLSPELRPHTNLFPPELEQKIRRLKKWKPSGSIRAMGKVYNKLFYSTLENHGKKGVVLEELQRRNPAYYTDSGYRRRHTHHQLLSESLGVPELKARIANAMRWLDAYRTWDAFERAWESAYGTQPGLFDPEV